MTIDKRPSDASRDFSGKIEWTKSLAAAPVKSYAALCQEALSSAERRLQENNEYLKSLSECKGPADVAACYTAFVRKSVSNSFDDGLRMLGHFYSSLSVANSRK